MLDAMAETGLPTWPIRKVFERARESGVIVLLDGQGLDEQWAGYDYYKKRNSHGSCAGEPRPCGAFGMPGAGV